MKKKAMLPQRKRPERGNYKWNNKGIPPETGRNNNQILFFENLGGAQVSWLVGLGSAKTNLGFLELRTVAESIPVI